jgi:hypothetical protein
MIPKLHKRIVVNIVHQMQIPTFISTIERYLSMSQRKQLKAESKSSSRRQPYSIEVDKATIPACASYVQHILISVSHTGNNHQRTVVRYLEELFKNFNSLEIVETNIITM